MKVYRSCGDHLSCWFAPHGGLSTAVLSVEDRSRHVTGHLVGLRQHNALEYVRELWFVPKSTKVEIAITKRVNARISDSEMFVESVMDRREGMCFSVILARQRILVCPRRLFVLVYDAVHNVVGFPSEEVGHKLEAKKFVDLVGNFSDLCLIAR